MPDFKVVPTVNGVTVQIPNDAEGDPASVTTAAADGTSDHGARRDHAHALADNVVTDAKLRDSAALSVIGRSVDSSGDPADIAAANHGEVLRRSGTDLAFGEVEAAGIGFGAVTNVKLASMAEGTIKGKPAGTGSGTPTDLSAAQTRVILNVADGANAYVHPNHSGDVTSVADGATTIANDAVTDAKLRDSTPLSVIGRSVNSSGDPADIAATQEGEVLRRSGTALGFGTVATAGITNEAVTNAKLSNMAQATVKGRASGAGTGAPTDLSVTELLALVVQQGTWTPTLIGSTTAGTNTYAAQNGVYIKIGTFVYASFGITINVANTVTMVGNVLLSGLPFTSGVTTRGGGSIATWLSLATAILHPTIYVNISTTNCGIFRATAASANVAAMPVGDLQNGSAFAGALFYHAAS